MPRRWHDDRDKIKLGKNLAVIGNRAGTVFGRNFGTTRRVGVNHGKQFYAVELSIFLCVEIAEVAYPDNSGPQRSHTLTRISGGAQRPRFVVRVYPSGAARSVP